MIPLLFAAATTTMISLNFPTAKVSEGCRLIHSPEQWASGAGLIVGVTPFAIRGVSGPTCYGKECMVNFEGLGQRFRLIGKRRNMCTVTIANKDSDIPHTTIVAKVIPLLLKGFRLVLYMEGEDDELLEELKPALEIGLWPCVETLQHQLGSTLVDKPEFVLYRRKLGICPVLPSF